MPLQMISCLLTHLFLVHRPVRKAKKNAKLCFIERRSWGFFFVVVVIIYYVKIRTSQDQQRHTFSWSAMPNRCCSVYKINSVANLLNWHLSLVARFVIFLKNLRPKKKFFFSSGHAVIGILLAVNALISFFFSCCSVFCIVLFCVVLLCFNSVWPRKAAIFAWAFICARASRRSQSCLLCSPKPRPMQRTAFYQPCFTTFTCRPR